MKISGHTEQRQKLARLFRTNRLPPALLFAGPSGIGKNLVAREFARSLFCSKGTYGGCGTCHNCHLFDAGSMVDFSPVECLDDGRLGVAELRELLNGLNLKPFGGGNRVVIFNNVEHITLAGANALLKSLEEPRPDTFYILIAANPAKLPPTLFSRCQTLFFNSLPPEIIRAVLEERGVVKDAQNAHPALSLDELTNLADGSLGEIEGLITHFEEWLRIGTALDQMINGATASALALAKELGKDKEALRIELKFMRIHGRARMRSAKDSNMAARWAHLVSAVIAAEYYIFERNISASYLLSYLFAHLSAQDTLPFTTLTHSGTLLEQVIV